jgi:hypothetical protein
MELVNTCLAENEINAQGTELREVLQMKEQRLP